MKIAEIQAQNLLTEYDMSDIPVDLIELAQQMGISVHERKLDEGVSGVLVIKNGRATIGINAHHHAHRQRFTLAHELGHFVLHRPKSGIFVDRTLTFRRDTGSSDGSTLEEIQANAFAAELLMPEAKIREIIEDIDLYDPDAVTKVASVFAVSEQALTIRLLSLGYISA